MTTPPRKRKEWFLRALGIDYLKTGSDTILKEEIDAKTGVLQGKEGELRALAGREDAEEFTRLQASVVRYQRRLRTIPKPGRCT